VVHPYNLISHKGAVYLLAFAPEHNQVRKYKIDRIDGVETRSAGFAKPSEGALPACWDRAKNQRHF
jgi:predicted DNA-binding transcriptional regulator YafY